MNWNVKNCLMILPRNNRWPTLPLLLILCSKKEL
jgi:hypothetical protein